MLVLHTSWQGFDLPTVLLFIEFRTLSEPRAAVHLLPHVSTLTFVRGALRRMIAKSGTADLRPRCERAAVSSGGGLPRHEERHPEHDPRISQDSLARVSTNIVDTPAATAAAATSGGSRRVGAPLTINDNGS